MRRKGILLAAVFALASSAATPALAQGEWTYRARLSAEATTAPTMSGLFVATADSTWNDGGRLKVGSGAIFTAADGGRFDITAREAYARASAVPWMDVEAGKRLLRWGVGYGFAPTGVLDPPRRPTDPTDRLGRNEGIGLARVDVFRAASSLTLAAAEDRTFAARARTVVAGVEFAAVVRAAAGERPAWGGNLTHVIGQQLEWHAEFLSHERPDAAGGPSRNGRTFSAVAGLQYTFTAGANVVLEYHRNGHGLNDREWGDVVTGRRAPGTLPERQQFLFVRVARSTTDATVAPELIAIASIDDGGWTVVPSIAWTPRARVQVYARGIVLAGPRGSVASFAPRSRALTAGLSLRF